jgi:small-conductance mechanosensitive channel
MKRPFKKPKPIALDTMFETRTEAWNEAGLRLHVDARAVRQAQRRLIVWLVLLAAVVIGHLIVANHFKLVSQYEHAKALAASHDRPFHGTPPADWHVPEWVFTTIAVIGIVVLGWLISRELSRIAPALFKRMDPGTAGTVGFVIRLAVVSATVLGALVVAGISLPALAVGGAFTAVVIGLAAQQTLGNLFAGMVLLSARPFRLGERVRLQAGAVGGSVEGIVSSQGLLYTTLARGEERIMIPNNVVLAAAVVPLREPDAVDVKVRLSAGTRPSHVQQMLDAAITVETRAAPNVVLEEIDGDEVVVRVRATPDRRSDGAKLADEIIATLANVTGEHQLPEADDAARR